MATEYLTESLIGGEIKTAQVALAADVYYRGMPLKYNAGDDNYSYDATAATLAAIFMEPETRTLADVGHGSVIVGGEIQEGGIVDDSGDAITITEDFIAAVAPRGFYIKRS